MWHHLTKDAWVTALIEVKIPQVKMKFLSPNNKRLDWFAPSYNGISKANERINNTHHVHQMQVDIVYY